MSVPASERALSRGEFVNAAVAVEQRVAVITRKLPKRWENDISAHVIDASRRMVEFAILANAIYTEFQCEYEDKLSLLNEAFGLLVYIDTTVDYMYRQEPTREVKKKNKDGCEEMVTQYLISEKSVKLLANEISRAENLIGGVRKSLKKQMKALNIT